jgi:Ca2+-binding RTX toxin-like protein
LALSSPAVPLPLESVAGRPAFTDTAADVAAGYTAGGGDEVLIGGAGDSLVIGEQGSDVLVGGFAADFAA